MSKFKSKMSKFKSKSIIGLAVAVCSWSGIAAAEGNRHGLARRYHSEISAAKAYLLTSHSRGQDSKRRDDGEDDDRGHRKDPWAGAVLIDVRDVNEYAAGHPDDAVSIPFPHIYKRPGNLEYQAQTPEGFLAAVMEALPDKNTPILLLCRTGLRSIAAGNILADAGYGFVRNIWEGFVGLNRTDSTGAIVDMNNDGVISDADLDGWSMFFELPYSTELRSTLLYRPAEHLYTAP